MAKRNLPNQNIDEVWIYEKGEIRLFYKDGKFYYWKDNREACKQTSLRCDVPQHTLTPYGAAANIVI